MTFGPEYSKIQTAFKRDQRNVIIPGDWTLPEFDYLQDNPWKWTEKVDGTNIRLHWNGTHVTIGGREDNAQLPSILVAELTMNGQLNPERWKAIFPDTDDVTVYGEGYGAGIIKGGQYRPDQSVVVFDVKIGEWWLREGDITDVAEKLSLGRVPHKGEWTLNEAWELIKADQLGSYWENARIEGIVGRPAVDLFARDGDRLIVKMKIKDWQDYQRRGKKDEQPHVP